MLSFYRCVGKIGNEEHHFNADFTKINYTSKKQPFGILKSRYS